VIKCRKIKDKTINKYITCVVQHISLNRIYLPRKARFLGLLL